MIVAEGTPEKLAANKASPTGRFLRQVLTPAPTSKSSKSSTV